VPIVGAVAKTIHRLAVDRQLQIFSGSGTHLRVEIPKSAEVVSGPEVRFMVWSTVAVPPGHYDGRVSRRGVTSGL
jgi:hypothetical protein